MSEYTELHADVADVLTELGQPMTLVRPGAAADYDAVTGEVSDDPDTTYSAQGIVDTFSQREIDDTNIFIGDKKLLLQCAERPQPNDRVIAGSAPGWYVVNISEVNPGGTNICYELQVRS